MMSFSNIQPAVPPASAAASTDDDAARASDFARVAQAIREHYRKEEQYKKEQRAAAIYAAQQKAYAPQTKKKGKKVTPNLRRIPNRTIRTAFNYYQAMGSRRSLRKLAAFLYPHKDPTTALRKVGKWSANYGWQEQVKQCDQLEHEQRARESEQRREERWQREVDEARVKRALEAQVRAETTQEQDQLLLSAFGIRGGLDLHTGTGLHDATNIVSNDEWEDGSESGGIAFVMAISAEDDANDDRP